MDTQHADDYLWALTKQIVQTTPVAIDTVYFGGGTPSLFGTSRIAVLLDVIANHFILAPNAEITLEANPESITPSTLIAWKHSGINRLSVGVQSLDEAALQWLGRMHTAKQAYQAVQQASQAGFDNINIDLLYGLPLQSIKHWQQTLESVTTWPIQHISSYGLKLELNTPLHKTGQTATDDEFAEQYCLMTELLPVHGFGQYEISNFARNGYEARHNMKYWQLQPYIGVGASAHGDFDGLRTAVVCDIRAYIHAMQTGGNIYTQQQTVTQRERAEEYLMLGLRTTHGVCREEYEKYLPRDAGAAIGCPQGSPFQKLASYQAHGLTDYVNLKGSGCKRWRLTPQGMLISNTLIGELLT